MSYVPQLPSNAPFTPEQRSWLNGWIAGVLAAQARDGDSAPAEAAPLVPVTILFGTQTGSAEGLAKKLSRDLQSKGFESTVLGMDQYAKADLANCERLLLITSTYGDGDPPDNAVSFWQWLNGEAPSLSKTQFSVLALGDTNYEKFCAFGKAVDARLEALGAKRIADRVDCDVDYDAGFAAWSAQVGQAFSLSSSAAGILPADTSISGQDARSTSDRQDAYPTGTKANPYSARLVTNQLLTTASAAKETRHFEININGLSYEPGDAIGIVPENDIALVNAILDHGGWSTDDELRHLLLHKHDITNPSKDLIQAVAACAKHDDLTALIDPARSADLKQWLYGRDVLDLLQLLPKGELSSTDFIALLKKLQPRLYSIASSLKAAPSQVHLTIAQVRYQSHGRARNGVCSTFLADRAQGDTPVPVFIQPSHGFKLPTDDTKPVIMIGPGTGVAPFRSFLQERQATGARGKNWLFFGEQSRMQSYFYKDEWATLIQNGVLHRMDTAFSRDQEQKIYVQHRMTENGAELYRWLEDGAHFYVCGDASRMAKDVDAALHQVIEQHGGKSTDDAKAYIAAMKEAKRYQRDVY
ncbi:MAG: sulfite reductase subunit alpha [Verrucomicrobiaceae bacterium]|nr:sulfite reductase subunit alpha [Verrucomicrobiaceae bacterium]